MQNSRKLQTSIAVENGHVPPFTPGLQKRAFWLGLGLIAVVALAAILWVVWGLQERERQFAEHLEKRLDLMVASETQSIGELVQETKREASRIISAELFQLYAADVHLVDGDISRVVAGLPIDAGGELSQLADQLPMMQNLLKEFVQINGYQAGRVVNRDKTVYLGTDAATTPLRTGQADMIDKTLMTGKEQVAPLRHSSSGLLLEMYLPIYPPETSNLDQRPVAVLFLSKAVSGRLNELRESNVMVEEGERVRLVQPTIGGYEEVVPWLPGQLRDVNFSAQLDAQGMMPFSLRRSLASDQNVYSLGVQHPELGWWVIAEADASIARAELRSHQRTIVSFASLLILFFGVTFGAIWAVMTGSQERRVARHFELLADKLDRQRQLLDRINNTISDQIVLKDLQGNYQYVNPAFARAVGRDAETLIGQNSEAVFGYDTARRLEHSDQRVLATGETVTFNEKVFLQSEPHYLQISKAPLKDAQDKIVGIVSVSRDITEMVEVQKNQEQATRKTVEALVRAIELTDPYLAGHSRLMGALAVEVAKVLNAGDIDIATVRTAANLCQVGKLFVNRDLLLKTGPLTDAEKKEMERHVEHAAKVLKDIDFGLPVFEAVSQMNEGMNGQGYPTGLSGEQIVFPARILGVVNSFCAMVQPRAYRGAREVDEALSILADEAGFYDPKVIKALEEVVHSAIGEKILLQKQTSA